MTIVLVAVCTVLTILCIGLCFKLASLDKDYKEYKELILNNVNHIMSRQDHLNSYVADLNIRVNGYITEPKMQEYANTAVSDALDGVDFDLERYDNAIKAMWQAIGTQKKRLDKIDPVKREPIDPAENLKHQSELMDKMLKQSTDIYAEKLSKKNTVNNSQIPTVGIDLTENGVHETTIVTPARGAGKDLYSKYMEKLNDIKDNFPAAKEPDTAAFPSDPEIEQYATTQIPTFANNSVADLDETMDISEFFTRVKNDDFGGKQNG